MRSTNPVLTRPNAFQPQTQTYDPQGHGQPYAQYPGNTPGAPYVQAGPTGLMTIDDVITKSAITMGILMLVAGASFFLMPLRLINLAMIVSAVVGFVAVLVVSLRRTVSPAMVLVYAGVEGVFIGALSRVFEYLYPGIVTQAVLGTFVAAGITLAAYKYFRIRVTNRFRQVVVISTMAFAGVLLLNLVVSLFGVNLGIVSVTGAVSLLAVVASLVGVVLAVLNLILDFDYIERGVAMRAPASESWRAAFGLTVTMVWLYTELLRILSYLRR